MTYTLTASNGLPNDPIGCATMKAPPMCSYGLAKESTDMAIYSPICPQGTVSQPTFTKDKNGELKPTFYCFGTPTYESDPGYYPVMDISLSNSSGKCSF
jgi:hypothetical protein